ncbi:hypothetical protein G6014_08735, partial [Dietzia kunjamensis]|nr:hypothetical protein [Dietzia kunjamensis]
MTTVRSSPEVPNLTTVPEPVEAGPGGDRPTHTHCPYCALQCAMTVTPAADPAAAVE